MCAHKTRFVLSALVFIALSGCQSRPTPTILTYDQLDTPQQQALAAYYTPDAVKAREEERQGRARAQRQWGDQFPVRVEPELEAPSPKQIQQSQLEEEARQNREQRKSSPDSGCNCRVKPFKAMKRAFGF